MESRRGCGVEYRKTVYQGRQRQYFTEDKQVKVSVSCNTRISLGAGPNTGFEFGRLCKHNEFYEGHKHSE